jgi:predicted RNase H-like nuclease (RuvC/YqgF family)
MTTCCALVIAVSLVLPAGQTRGAADADLKELSAYTLSMDTLNKVDRAMRAAMTEMRKDPKFQEVEKLKAELEALKKKDEKTEEEDRRMETLGLRIEELESAASPLKMNDAASISEMAANIQKEPRLAVALQGEGLTPREFSKFMLAMLQAGFAAGMQKAGLLKTTPEGTNPANIKWVLDHEADLQKMQQAWNPEKEKKE